MKRYEVDDDERTHLKTMIDLAPHNKYGLPLKSPVMAASGAVGYGDEYSDLIDYSLLGALVTNPVSLRPRKSARGTRLRTHSGHLIVHTGLPNPGIKAVVQKYRKVWERLPIPVIIHLLATTPGELSKGSTYLSNVAGVQAIELGLADNTKPDRAVQMLHAAVTGDLPVIVKIPFRRVDELAPLLAEEGASALTLTAPPRVVLPPQERQQEENSRFYRGRLYGPAVFPLMLETLSRWSRKLPVPIVACGGIQTSQQALACINLGATAVQIDAVLWRNPALIHIISIELTHLVTSFIDKDADMEENDDNENLENGGDNISDLLVGT